MKYFRVEEEYIAGMWRRMEVASDGEQVAEGYDVGKILTITIGYTVFIENEQGRTEDIKFYPVKTDMQTFEDNQIQVLEQIKRDFPAPAWQNHNW